MEPVEECGGGGGGSGGGLGDVERKNGNLRIYVGGLGGNVTVDDLIKTFSSPQLGTVESVEIIRTKDRSFAYLGFSPCSDKGLAKLFSTYNGCMWKGGRLRLEKAKEHYIVRLRREWEEDAKLSSDSHKYEAAVRTLTPQKLVKDHNSENLQLRLFFPKLRKIKPVPFKGTGKHKYSFQRIEVPPLPIHFCDCEEHSGPLDTVKEFHNQENEVGGMNEKELNMMNSVMNKLFEWKNISETAYKKVGFAAEALIPANSIDDFQVDEKENEMSDDDNLVINMVAGSNDKITSTDALVQKTITGNEESHVSQSRSVQRKRGHQEKKILQSNKKRKATPDDEAERNGNPYAVVARKGNLHGNSVEMEIFPDVQTTKPGSGIQQSSYSNLHAKRFSWKDLVSGRDDGSFHISDVIPSNHPVVEMQSKIDNSDVTNRENQRVEASRSKEVIKSAEAVCETRSSEVNKAGKTAVWQQKSSWRQILGGSSDSSFSISQIVPGMNLEKQEPPQLKDIDISQQQNVLETVKSDFTADSLAKSKPNQASLNLSNPVKTLLAGKSGEEACTLPFSEKKPMHAKRTTLIDTGAGQGFTFKRSSASMKEWKMAKAAVSGSLKKKVNEK